MHKEDVWSLFLRPGAEILFDSKAYRRWTIDSYFTRQYEIGTGESLTPLINHKALVLVLPKLLAQKRLPSIRNPQLKNPLG